LTFNDYEVIWKHIFREANQEVRLLTVLQSKVCL